jgi:hypothetical protein
LWLFLSFTRLAIKVRLVAVLADFRLYTRDSKLIRIANRREGKTVAGVERLGYGRALQWDKVSGGVDIPMLRKSKKL